MIQRITKKSENLKKAKKPKLRVLFSNLLKMMCTLTEKENKNVPRNCYRMFEKGGLQSKGNNLLQSHLNLLTNNL